MNKKSILWIILGITGLGACLVTCIIGFVLYQVGSTVTQASKSAALVGSTAPDFTLVSLNNETVQLEQMLDKPVFLCFGTTWCPDCKREAPLLQRLYEEYPDVHVLWVDSKESTATVRQFIEKEGLTFPVLIDQNGKVMQDYMVWAVPTVYVIDTDGTIRARFVEKLTQEMLEDTLAELGIEE